MNNSKKIAVCAICRNEKDYIEEWVAYYKYIGFDSVFVYDNVSDDGTSEVLLALDATQEIKRVHWPRVEGVPPQRAAYSDFIHNYASDYDYVLICDLDEFLVVEGGGSVKALIDEAESRHGDVGAIAFPWLIFGSGGADSQASGLVVERFTQCEKNISTTVKTMFKSRRTYNMRTHICDLTGGVYLNNNLDEADWDEKMPIRLKKALPGRAVIHHYYTKSREEWIRRRSQPKADRAKIETKRIAEFDRYSSLPAKNFDLYSRADAIKLKMGVLKAKLIDMSKTVGGEISLVTLSKDWIFGVVHGAKSDNPLRIRMLGDDLKETFFETTPTSSGVHVFTFKPKWLHLFNRSFVLTVVGSVRSYEFSLDKLPEPIRALEHLSEYFSGAEEHNFSSLLACVQKAEYRDEALRVSSRFKFVKYPKMANCLDALRQYFLGSSGSQMRDYLKVADDEIRSSLSKIDSVAFKSDFSNELS